MLKSVKKTFLIHKIQSITNNLVIPNIKDYINIVLKDNNKLSN